MRRGRGARGPARATVDESHDRALVPLYGWCVPTGPPSRAAHGRRRLLPRALVAGAAAGALCLAGVAAGADRTRALHVTVSVPSVGLLAGKDLWIANTGTSSMLEFDAATGVEVADVGGSKYQLDDSDSVFS